MHLRSLLSLVSGLLLAAAPLRAAPEVISPEVKASVDKAVAWLLTQRAVAAGELTQAQAGETERRLGPAPESDEALLPRLPRAAVDLIRTSEELYERVRRLDEGSFGDAPHASPARSLLNRLERSL